VGFGKHWDWYTGRSTQHTGLKFSRNKKYGHDNCMAFACFALPQCWWKLKEAILLKAE
jgi:hypothetical protein